mmetsp:Transcript_27384/g.69275  ORF Transcript_27384/g.69275 Transcript_27384/m.69275 type:complete len:321 (+) Transcript_27384:167-1129(+)
MGGLKLSEAHRHVLQLVHVGLHRPTRCKSWRSALRPLDVVPASHHVAWAFADLPMSRARALATIVAEVVGLLLAPPTGRWTYRQRLLAVVPAPQPRRRHVARRPHLLRSTPHLSTPIREAAGPRGQVDGIQATVVIDSTRHAAVHHRVPARQTGCSRARVVHASLALGPGHEHTGATVGHRRVSLNLQAAALRTGQPPVSSSDHAIVVDAATDIARKGDGVLVTTDEADGESLGSLLLVIVHLQSHGRRLASGLVGGLLRLLLGGPPAARRRGNRRGARRRARGPSSRDRQARRAHNSGCGRRGASSAAGGGRGLCLLGR